MQILEWWWASRLCACGQAHAQKQSQPMRQRAGMDLAADKLA
jgi:hypothetical protein